MQSSSMVATILFTDIEGSTGWWEREGERMAAALAQHDALARAAVEGNRGVIAKMTGDGICAAFDDPLDALDATLAFQRSLGDPAATNGIPLRVRCGLHLGAVERRDDDYFGTPVNRTAQIMSAAHGGQMLLSRAVVDGIGERLPAGVSLRDLGRVRLKDLATPEHIYQVLHPELPQEFPALRSLESTPNNLPQLVTSFIGRERELAEAKKLLEGARLLTLLGMGGLGKTRLSMQIGADMMNAFPDGVWFVDLAPIVDPELVPNTVAQVMGLLEEPGRPLIQTLCAHLGQQKLILIFDNCEHLLGACASLAGTLLQETSDIRIIATSREALHVPGERTYAVFPLALPDRNAGVESISRSEAVQLFMERARLQKPGFALTERDAPAVAEICARLEGIPLAMELAAARMRSLSVQDINARLKDRFKLLTGGSRVALERQQTLRALVAWSYDMLQETEQRLLERLAVFAGGFDLAAAKEVCGTEPIVAEEVSELLSSLVDKSLAMPEQVSVGARYRQLETIREFARECLNKREDAAEIAVRHCDHYFVFAKAVRDGVNGPEQAEWIRRAETDLDNLRAGINLSLEGRADPFLIIKYEAALMGFRMLRGYSSEGRKYIRAALTLPAVQASELACAHALYVGGALADDQSDYAEAHRMLEESLELRRGLGNPGDIAVALSTLAQLRLHEGDAANARKYEEEALALFREIGADVEEAIAIGHLGDISLYLMDDDAATRHFEEGLAKVRVIGQRELEGEFERKLGEIELERGNAVAAAARFARSHQVCKDAEDRRGEAMVLWATARSDAASGDHASARAKLTEALRALQAFGMHAQALGCLEDLGEVLRSLSRADIGARLYGTVESFRKRLALPRPPRAVAKWNEVLAKARADLGDAAFETARAEGCAWELEEAIRRALAATEAEPAAA